MVMGIPGIIFAYYSNLLQFSIFISCFVIIILMPYLGCISTVLYEPSQPPCS